MVVDGEKAKCGEMCVLMHRGTANIHVRIISVDRAPVGSLFAFYSENNGGKHFEVSGFVTDK